MTNREFFTNISNGVITELEIEHAKTALVKMDETNAKRKEKAKEADKGSKWAEENAELIEQAYAALGTETKIAADVAEALGISTSKATPILKHLVATERATVAEMKVPKRGTVKAYTAVIAE